MFRPVFLQDKQNSTLVCVVTVSVLPSVICSFILRSLNASNQTNRPFPLSCFIIHLGVRNIIIDKLILFFIPPTQLLGTDQILRLDLLPGDKGNVPNRSITKHLVLILKLNSMD